MALPKIDKPLYVDKLPSDGSKITYRPFTVKEEKILLSAQQSDDFVQGITAIKQILGNCIIDREVEELSIFDAEYILLKIRSKSVDDMIELNITDEEDGKEVAIKINLNDVKVNHTEGHTKYIDLGEDMKLQMKYPSIDVLYLMADTTITPSDMSYNILLNCLDKIITPDTVYNFKDESDESVNAFLDDLDKVSIKKIEQFFETSPKMRHAIKYKNSLGNEKTFVIEGTKSFFM